MTGLPPLRDAAAAKAADDAKAALRLPRPGQRLDPGLALTLGGLATVGAVGAWALAGWLEVSGHLDPPLPAEVEDPRILTDYRDNPSPMVDLLPLVDALLIGRRDGSIDRFDMAGRRFATESLPRGGGLTGDLDLMSGDCAGGLCGPTAAYAVTDKGGLARREGGDWQIVLGDMAFIGLDGLPVEQAELRGWAVSDGGDLVLVDAGVKGLGLFDQRDGSWRSGPAIADVTEGPLSFAGSFWLGSPAGLHRIAPGAARSGGGLSTDWGGEPVPGTEGRILDLSLHGKEGLLVLRSGACNGAGAGCLSVLEVGREAQVSTLLQEVEANPDLNDGGLLHVVMQGADLLTLGQSGVHRYDAAHRHWRLIDPQTPTAHFAEVDGARLHIALPDRVITLAGGGVQRTVALKAPLVQVLPGSGSDLFGLDRQGQILVLTPPEAQILTPADTGTPPDARFQGALALGDLFVALGPQGILIHDVVTRRYSFLPAQVLPPLPLSDAILVPGTSGRFWLVSRRSGEVWSLSVGGDFPDKIVTAEALGGPAEPVVQARADGAALMLITRSGAHHRLQPDGQITPQLGLPLTQNLTPLAAAAAAEAYLFTDGPTLWLYNAVKRGWYGPVPAPTGHSLTDVALTDQEILALGGVGTVHRLAEDTWDPVTGGPERAGFGLAGLQDAMSGPNALFLASDSMVQSYLPQARRFGSRWQQPGRGAEILAIENGVPLWTNSSGVFRGETPVYSGSDFVDGWLGATGPVALGRIGGSGGLYLAGPMGCLFVGAPAPRGEMRQVVQLDATRILVVTDEGAGIYEPDLHRWLPAFLPGLGADSRLLRLGAHLVRLDHDGIASVPIEQIAQAPSCEAPRVTITWAVSATMRAASLVDGQPEVLLLDNNGTLRRWRAGQISVEQSSPGQAPVMGQVLRAYPSGSGPAGNDPIGSGIEMLTATAWWHYDAGTRVWRSLAFQGAPSDVTQIDMQRDGEGRVLTLWDRQGEAFATRWTGQGDAIDFSPLRRRVLPEIPLPPDQIRDMAQLGDRAAVLTDARLLVYPPGAAAPALDLALPAPQRGWQLGSDATGALILTDGPADAALSIHRIDPAQTGRGDLAAVAAHYLPRDDLDHAFLRDRAASLSGTVADIALLRIDPDLNSWRCALVPGKEPRCTLLTGPPLPMEPDEILAYAGGPRVLLTKDALWQLDDAARPRARIQGPELQAAGALLRNGLAALYWEGPGRALWRLDDAQATLLHAQVTALRPAGNSFAALVDGRVLQLHDGQLTESPLPAAQAAETLRLSHFTQGGTVWITASGRVIADQGRLVSDPLLPFAADAQAILPLPQGFGAQAWLDVARDGGLRILSIGECEVPAPLPPGPPPEFIGPSQPPVILPPDLVPCAMEQVLPLVLDAGEQLMDLRRDANGGLLIQTSQRDITLNAALAQVTGADPVTLLSTPDEMTRARPVGGTAQVGGRSYLNPPWLEETRLLGGARAISFEPRLTSPLPAYDIGWLSWQRASGSFRFSAGPAPVDMPPAQAIRDGRFLPLAEARALALPGGRVAWLTPSGLWQQSPRGIWPVALAAQSLPQGIDEGQFLWSGGMIEAAEGGVTNTPPPRSFLVAGIELLVDPLAGSIGAWLELDGQRQPDLAAQGFQHDQRHSVAQTGSQAVYLTPSGLIPTDSLTGGRLAPAGSTLLAAEGGNLLAQTGTDWLARTPSGWTATAAPFQTGTLAQENGRVWERRDGRIGITAAEPWQVARQGLDFDIDRLLGFAATPGVVVAVTAAGTHAAPGVDGLAGVSPPLAPAPSDLPLDAGRADPARHVLYSPAGEVWDGSASAWRPAGPDERPWQTRGAASLSGLELRFDPAPRASIDVTLTGGGSGSLPFSWRQGEAMPFDHATALHADATGANLLIGTRLGLRRLVKRGMGYDSGPLFLPQASGQPMPTEVTAVGRPDATPQRIETTFADGSCAEMAQIGDAPVDCTAPQGLATRFVASTPEWHVTKSAAAVDWSYLIDGIERPLNQPMRDQMPHDLLSDRLICVGQVVEAWRDLPVLSIDGSLYQLGGLEGLHCQPSPTDLGSGQRLEAGLHAVTDSVALRFDGTGFTSLTASQAEGLRDRQSGRVTMEKGRLTYGLEVGLPLSRHRSLADLWLETPWEAGRMALDQPRALAWRDGLQSITDAGVVAAPDGRLQAVGLVMMEGATAGTLAACEVTGAEALDGRSHGLAALPGAPLRLYCRDGSWLQGVANGSRDIGTFAPQEAKPSERQLVSVSGLWSVSATFGTDDKAEAIEFHFRDEPARLAGGRFDFDAFQAIAAPFGETADLVSDSGWWRAPADGLALDQTERPDLPLDPQQVSDLTTDLSRRNGEAGLCLTQGDAAQFWAGGPGLETAGTCRENRGRDPLWQWWQEDGRATSQGIGRNGIALDRALVAGRFEDLVVTGPPLALADGGLMVPAKAGILVMAPQDPVPLGIYALDNQGALARSATGAPVWIGREGAVLLEGEGAPVEAPALACPGLARLAASLPEGNRLLRVQPHGAGWVSALIGSPESRVQALVDCSDPYRNRLWSSRHDISDHPRNLARGAGRAETLEIGLGSDGLTLEDGIRQTMIAEVGRGALQALALDRDGEELFVIEDGRLMSISLASAMAALDASGRPVSTPAPAPAAPAAPPPVQDPATTAPAASAPALPPPSAPAAASAPPAVPAGASPLPSAASRASEASYDAREVQTALVKTLGESLTADGVIGPQSRAAIARWQAWIGAEPTGYLGPEQLDLLLREAAG